MQAAKQNRSTLTAIKAPYRVQVGIPGAPSHRADWDRDPDSEQVGGTRSFLPAVEGMRACAAIGVVITHVAFQTGHSSGVAGRLFGRFDLAVAVFFALSGFLLWRGHAAAARGLAPRPPTGHYLRSRVVRIMPAYLVAVVVILTLLPDADHAEPDGVAGESVAHPDLCAADTDRRPDADVEPVGRGQLLSGVADPRAAGRAACRCGPGCR